MATLIQILAAAGYDGLVDPHSECGCLLSDMAPCLGSPAECAPGYRGACKDDPEEWAIYRSKEAAEESLRAAPTTTPGE